MKNNPNIEIETKLIERFVTKAKRDRYQDFIQRDKTRLKFSNDLHHLNFLQQDLFEEVIRNEYEIIKGRIKDLGISDCYVISENKRIDKQAINIDDSINHINNSIASIH